MRAGRRNRKWLILGLCLLLCLTSPALGESASVELFGVSIGYEDQAVDFGKNKVTDLDALCQGLDRLPNLRRVDMYASGMPKERMEEFSLRYPNIRFGWTIKLDQYRIRTDATAFSTLKDGSPPYLSSKRLSVLRYCGDMLGLDLGHNSVTDISFLEGMPKLRVLILGRNSVADLAPLAQLRDLEYLELFSNQITDLTPLAALTHLIDLNLCNNAFTDLSPLYGLSGLQRLWIAMNDQLSQEQVDALRAALPNTEINVTATTCTGGGWRGRHPRYLVVRRMFKRGTYLPWDE